MITTLTQHLRLTQAAQHVEQARYALTQYGSVKSEAGGCAWWNLACQGSHQVANAGMSAITQSTAAGTRQMLSEIVRYLDQSSQVPLADPTYQKVYVGFLGLALPVIGIVLLFATVTAALRRDGGTLARAVVGVGIATLGGALYIVFAQALLAIDNSLAHGIVDVTGYDLKDSITELAAGFGQVSNGGYIAANMLLILLMFTMLISGTLLWFILALRKTAILVVVAFAPLLIAGYLWAPTRSWVRRLTEVLIALVFTKSAIYMLFGVGIALMSRGGTQSFSDLVGACVLMSGACFAPMVMLRLVHFAADSHLAGDAINTLRTGARPVTSRMPIPSLGSGSGRLDMARSQGQAPTPAERTSVGASRPTPATSNGAGSNAGGGATGGGKAAGAAGAAGAATVGAVLLAKQGADKVTQSASTTGDQLMPPSRHQPTSDRADDALRGHQPPSHPMNGAS